MTDKKVAFCSVSGGKDSLLSLYKAKEEGVRISCMVNMASDDGIHSRSHGLLRDSLKAQADALNIPLFQRHASWDDYENEFKNLIHALKKQGVNTGIFGDIDFEPHREWVEKVCNELDIEPLLPLWKLERKDIMSEFIELGFKGIVCTVNAKYMGQEWLSREINTEFVNDIINTGGIDLCGENGEYHTYVYDGPGFNRPVLLKTGEVFFHDNCWFIEVII